MLLKIIMIASVMAIPSVQSIFASQMKLSPRGNEFHGRNSLDLIGSTNTPKLLRCAGLCNINRACRTFDYDFSSGRCRLFESDLTAGSIVPSTSPASIVGSVYLSPALFLPVYNQPCQTCEENRYVLCPSNTAACQCPSHTYWNGSMCLLQLIGNSTCSQADACRMDLNLTCSMDGYGRFIQCAPGTTEESNEE